jgi:hypothetical protein
MIKTLLTFDYELYFGDNYLLESEVLFEPTNKILNLLNYTNTKAIFFIDIMSIIAYKKYKQFDYVDKFTEQVKNMIELGHNIEFHFHPHWIDSKYINSKWEHKFQNWSYSNLVDNLGLDKANDIFKEAYSLFVEITGLNPTSFRAGGYTIEPYQEELIKVLNQYNFRYDSSITPYKRFISDAQIFDFLDVEDKNYWNIKNNSFKSYGENKLIELPIMVLKKDEITKYKYYLLKIVNKFLKNIVFEKRGKGATLKPKEYINNALAFSFDISSNKDKKIIKFLTDKYIKKYKQNNIIYLNILSHPKAIFEESLDVMKWYIKFMKKEYNTTFVGFDDI